MISVLKDNIHKFIDIVKMVLLVILYAYSYIVYTFASNLIGKSDCDVNICYHNGSKMGVDDNNRCNNDKCEKCSQCTDGTDGTNFWALSEDFGGKDDDWTVDNSISNKLGVTTKWSNDSYDPETTEYETSNSKYRCISEDNVIKDCKGQDE